MSCCQALGGLPPKALARAVLLEPLVSPPAALRGRATALTNAQISGSDLLLGLLFHLRVLRRRHQLEWPSEHCQIDRFTAELGALHTRSTVAQLRLGTLAMRIGRQIAQFSRSVLPLPAEGLESVPWPVATRVLCCRMHSRHWAAARRIHGGRSRHVGVVRLLAVRNIAWCRDRPRQQALTSVCVDSKWG